MRAYYNNGLIVTLISCFILILLFVNKPVFATHFKGWGKRLLCHKIDLVTQASYSEIVPGLFLSNSRAASDKHVLKHLNITHILTIETRQLPKQILADNSIHFMFIHACDTPKTNLLPYFAQANSFIASGLKDGNVIVHCYFGVSRSATIVIAYLMETYKMNFDQAFKYVRQRRSFINPNKGFVTQLKEYEKIVFDVNGFSRFKSFFKDASQMRCKVASAVAFLGLLIPLILVYAHI